MVTIITTTMTIMMMIMERGEYDYALRKLQHEEMQD